MVFVYCFWSFVEMFLTSFAWDYVSLSAQGHTSIHTNMNKKASQPADNQEANDYAKACVACGYHRSTAYTSVAIKHLQTAFCLTRTQAKVLFSNAIAR